MELLRRGPPQDALPGLAALAREKGHERIAAELGDHAALVLDRAQGFGEKRVDQRGDPLGALAALAGQRFAQRREAGSAFDHVSAHLNLRRRKKLLVVHRIDRDTSGLVVFAKTVRAQKQLKDQFLQRRPERVYVALVHGHPRPPEGTWRDELVWDADALLQKRAHPRDPKKKEAVTRYRVLETLGNVSLLEIRLETGKRNQIRIQARLHGHALVGERLYAGRAASQVSIPFGRQALHAYRLSFEHPTSGRMVAVESPLPTDMKELLERLRRQSA